MRQYRGIPNGAGFTFGRGTILIVTMWIVLVLAGVVLVMARTMRVEAVCSANDCSIMQAQAIERGAIQYVISHVDSLDGAMPDDAYMPCEAVRVGDGAFWILRSYDDDDDTSTYCYGVTDESAKLNLNTANLSMLEMLPDESEVIEELAACIVDWRDSDSTVSTNGAESEYYLWLTDPYDCKNADFETVEELFLVEWVTPEVLYGEDANRNGVLDPNEDDASASEPADDKDGQLDRGLYPFVTVYSQEANVNADGEARVNINSTTSSVGDLLSSLLPDRSAALTATIRRERPFNGILDFYVRAGLTPTELATIEDYITTSSSTTIKGRINVSTAPAEVLACLPGLDANDVAAILATRADTSATDLLSVAWVANALTQSKISGIGNYITTKTSRYSADIVSVSGDGRAFRRCRVVIDATDSPPRVIYRQDLTHLGWPLSPEILARLRAGESLDSVISKTVTREVAR